MTPQIYTLTRSGVTSDPTLGNVPVPNTSKPTIAEQLEAWNIRLWGTPDGVPASRKDGAK